MTWSLATTKVVRGLAGALVGWVALGLAAAHAQDTALRELMRKAAVGEDENGFCATTGWPAGSAKGNDAFRDHAVVGSMTRDTFDGGAVCASARVTQVFFEQGKKCVRYQWWACGTGRRCASGTTLSCKRADGAWQDRAG